MQGRGGDDLAAEYARALERSMYTGLSGIGSAVNVAIVLYKAGYGRLLNSLHALQVEA